MKPGDTFIGGGEIHGTDHLWLVLNDPAAHGGTVLLVNLSTLRPDAETTCLLRPGEHGFITRDSYVRYRSARAAKTADLEKLVKAGRLKLHRAASKELLEKVRAGANASPQLAAELKSLL